MLSKLKNNIQKLYDKKVESVGLALFRITYYSVFFCEILQFYYFRHLIFDYVPYIEEYEINFTPILIVWLLIILFLIIGLFTRTSAIINYILTLTFLATIKSYEYHMFYAYTGLNFLLMFMPINKSLSIDRIITRIRYSNSKYTFTPSTKVSVLNYYIPLFIGIALVYFDSVLFKVSSKNWMAGIGMWTPSVLPQFNHYGNSAVLNIKWLALFLGYATLVFEAIMIFFFWYKPFRWPFLLIGWGLHVGILIFFPIPWFALSVCFLYFLLVPIKCWIKIGFFLKSKHQSLIFIYDGDCPLCNKTKILISSIDIFNKIKFLTIDDAKLTIPAIANIPHKALIENIYSISPKGQMFKGINTYIQVFLRMIYTAPIGFFLLIPGVYHFGKRVYAKIAKNRIHYKCTDEDCAIPSNLPVNNEEYKILRNYSLKNFKVAVITYFFVFVIFMQVCVSYHSGIITILRERSGIDRTSVGRILSTVTAKIRAVSKTFLGITNHPVFMDGHMKGYNHIIAVQHSSKNGNKTWLPIINDNGQPDYYNYGFNWVHWTFRVNNPVIDIYKLKKGIRDFTAFWLYRQNKNHDNQKFIILVKKIDEANHWEKNFLEKQMKKPWIEAGYCEWNDKQFTITVEKDIESL